MAKIALLERRTEACAEVLDLDDYRTARCSRLVHDGRDLMVEGREEDALAMTFEALRFDPDGYDALALAGTLLAILGDHNASVVYTRRAIRNDPARADAYYELGSTLLELGRAGEAFDWLEDGIARLGDRTDDLVDFMFSAKIEALVELGRFPEARAALSMGRERSQDALQLLSNAEEFLESRRRQPLLRVVDGRR